MRKSAKHVADDVLAIINFINAKGSGPIPANAVTGTPFGFLDTEKDNQIVAGDVLNVINFMNAHPGGSEAPAEPMPRSQSEAAADLASVSCQELSQTYALSDLLSLLAADIAAQADSRRRV